MTLQPKTDTLAGTGGIIPNKDTLPCIPSLKNDVYFHVMENITIEQAKSLLEVNSAEHIRSRLDAVCRAESRRVFATLIRLEESRAGSHIFPTIVTPGSAKRLSSDTNG